MAPPVCFPWQTDHRGVWRCRAPSPPNPRAPAEAPPPPVVTPGSFVETLTCDELRAFLASKYAGLEDCLKPNITARLLFELKKEKEPIKDCFVAVPLEHEAQLIAFDLLLKKLVKASEHARELAKAAHKKAIEKQERRQKAEKLGVLGKAPEPTTRKWADILGTAKANQKSANDKAIGERVAKERAELEEEGVKLIFGVPAEDKYQAHHAFLLGHGEDHLKEVLTGMGCKLVSFNKEGQQLEVEFSGAALAAFFKEVIDKELKKLNREKPVTAQQFFGRHWVAGANEKAKDRDTEIATAHDDEWLVHQMNIHLKVRTSLDPSPVALVLDGSAERCDDRLSQKIRTSSEHKMKVKTEEVGQLTAAELAAPEGPAKEAAHKALGAEKAALQTLIDEQTAAEAKARATWARRRALRAGIEETRRSRIEAAQEAVMEGKRRKLANIEASEEMAAAALAAATKTAAAAPATAAPAPATAAPTIATFFTAAPAAAPAVTPAPVPAAEPAAAPAAVPSGDLDAFAAGF